MLINAHTIVRSDKLLLVPYMAVHVPRYHAWMSDPVIRSLTASEPLTLEEEYEMQAAWQADDDKLTFIVTRPTIDYERPQAMIADMIGDVNMFLSQLDDDDHEDGSNREELTQEHADAPADGRRIRYTGELELMIADDTARRQGFGRASLKLFMSYIVKHKATICPAGDLVSFTVKIGEDNEPSMCLFERLGFSKVKYASYFKEWEFALDLGAFDGYDSIDEVTVVHSKESLQR